LTSKLRTNTHTHTHTHTQNSTLSDNKGPLKLSAREPITNQITLHVWRYSQPIRRVVQVAQ